MPPARLMPHVVIVGAGFAGLCLARKLAKWGFRVTLLDKRNYHQFTPLLYQVATAELAPSEIAVPIRSLFTKYPRVVSLVAEVTEVDLDRQRVTLKSGENIRYNYLILAAGATSQHVGADSDWGKYVYRLDDLESAVRLRERLLLNFEAAERTQDTHVRKQLLTVCVVGGGPSGVETAGAIADLGKRILAKDYRHIQPEDVRVLLFEAGGQLLGTFPRSLGDRAKSQLEELGVEVFLNEPMSDLQDGQLVTDQRSVSCRLVCWGGGVKPAPLVERIKSPKRNGKLVVDNDCSLPRYARVFAIGDMASFQEPGKDELPGLAPVALQQAKHVARTLKRDQRHQPRKFFRYRDRGVMATIGRSRAVAQIGSKALSGTFAWLAWVVLHVWYLVGFRNRVLVLAEWAWAYLGARRGARLIQRNRNPTKLDPRSYHRHSEAGTG